MTGSLSPRRRGSGRGLTLLAALLLLAPSARADSSTAATSSSESGPASSRGLHRARR